MKRFLILALLYSPLVFGATFNWMPPTEYEDGLPLPNGDITEYRIYCNGVLLATVVNTPDLDVYDSGPLAPGSYDCAMTAVAGLESGQSNTVNFTVDPSQPLAPTGFTVSFP